MDAEETEVSSGVDSVGEVMAVQESPGNRSYRYMTATLWVLGIKSCSCRRAASALN